MRAHPVVCFFAFTSSPLCRKMMCNRELSVKTLLICLHLLGEQLSGISDGSKRWVKNVNLVSAWVKAVKMQKPSPLRICLSGE